MPVRDGNFQKRKFLEVLGVLVSQGETVSSLSSNVESFQIDLPRLSNSDGKDHELKCQTYSFLRWIMSL